MNNNRNSGSYHNAKEMPYISISLKMFKNKSFRAKINESAGELYVTDTSTSFYVSLSIT